MNPKDAFAMAIFMYEGGRMGIATVRCIRNNNPGNLRPYQKDQIVDSNNYRVFKTFVEGWQALLDDIQHKLDKHKELITVLDFLNRYAPAGDNNKPTAYARFVCGWLSGALGFSITVNTKLISIFT
jgi:hypothetical protein